jgi:hypothetical protein
MPQPIPPDHDLIVCHPDDLRRIESIAATAAGMVRVKTSRHMERGKWLTMKQPDPIELLRPTLNGIPFPDDPASFHWTPRRPKLAPRPWSYTILTPLPAVFVPESSKQGFARVFCNWHLRGRAAWRKARKHLKMLLDPNYRHPKAIRKVAQ